MKKILQSFAALLLASLVVASCNKNSPKDVATTWLTSFYHMDYEAAKKVSTEDTKALLTQLSALSGMMPDSSKAEMKKAVVTIKDVKEDGDKATVTYTISGMEKDAPKDFPALKLVKQSGKWLVQFSKSEMGGPDAGSGAGPADSTGAPPAPAADAAPADTAKH